MREKKKNKESVLVAESAYNSQSTQFGLGMIITEKKRLGPYSFKNILEKAFSNFIYFVKMLARN